MPATFGAWEAAVNGNPGNLNATNHASEINQMLGTHAITPIYEGARIITPVGGCGGSNYFPGNSKDVAQPFVMPAAKTVVSRVSLPIIYYGGGADVVVTLVPQSGGIPSTNNVLARTVVPYQQLTSLTSPTGLANGGPLVSPQNHNVIGKNDIPVVTWGSVTVDSSGSAIVNQAIATSGNYLISAGGKTANITGAVVTAQFLGQGNLASPQIQPAVPQASFFGMLAATSDSLVYAGGNTTVVGTTLVPTVYTASWNNLTGEVGAWSAQASIPVAIQNGQAAAYNNTVYILGGVDGSGVLQNAVYYANVSNGQITTWNRGPVLPFAYEQMAAGVVNGWLIVAGGNTNPGGSTAVSTVIYAKINADGSLGGWQTGPSLPTAVHTWGPGWNQSVTSDAFCVVAGIVTGGGSSNLIQTLSVGPNGVGDYWKTVTAVSGASIDCAFPLANGSWNLFFLNFGGSFYQHTVLAPMPLLSVPLYATGLTPGNTYYVMIQEHQYVSSSDFISITRGNGSLPGDTLVRNRNNTAGGAWTTLFAGNSVPMVVYDNTPGGQPLHTWEDPESTGSTANSNFAGRTTSFIYGNRNNIIGVADSTLLPNDPLNRNPTFTTGVSSWTTHNCTFVQSNAQTHGGFPFSGLMTPNGVSATVNVTSELIPIHPALVAFGPVVWVQLNGWFYSPTGYGTVSLSADWYDAGNIYITTTNSSVGLAAATWTNLVSYYQPPANAFYVSINVLEGSTPGASNTLFLSDVTVQLSPEQTTSLPAISQITYVSDNTWPPSGVVQLF